MLEVKDVEKKYHNQIVLDGLSFELVQGDRIGILGDNGSGKSTLMAIIAGTIKPDKGSVILNGKAITKKSRKKISYVPQVPELLEDLSVKDNLELWHSLYGLKDFHKMMQDLPPFLQMESMLYRKVFSLSGGMKKKVSIAIALMNKPNILILDEALAALDKESVEAMLLYLLQLKEVILIYSSHNMNEIDKLCNKVLELKKGIASEIT